VGAGTTGSSGAGAGTGTGAAAAPGPVSKDCGFLGSCAPGDLPAIPTVNTVQQAGTNYMSAINGAPIVQAFGNLSASMPTGSCPAPTMALFGKTFVMDAHCTLFNSLSGTIGAIMMVVYLVLGARILMSA
jgi:hypothetical protein